jgi:hypothetical protein
MSEIIHEEINNATTHMIYDWESPNRYSPRNYNYFELTFAHHKTETTVTLILRIFNAYF